MIFIIGVAGAGKSTQCKLLVETGKFQWLSVGQMLRESELEPEIKMRIQKGEVLDDDLVIPMVERRIEELGNNPELVIDGYPRTTRQVDRLLEGQLSGKQKISHVFHLVVEEETAHERLKSRGRSDDHVQAILERFKEYKDTIVPIVEDLAQHGVVVANINGNQSAEEVHKDIMAILGKYEK